MTAEDAVRLCGQLASEFERAAKGAGQLGTMVCREQAQAIRTVLAALAEAEQDKQEANGLFERIDIQVGSVLQRIGRLPDPPASSAGRLDVLCRLVVDTQRERDRLIEAWPSYQTDGRVYFDAGAGYWKTQGRSECFASREAAVFAAAGIEAKGAIDE